MMEILTNSMFFGAFLTIVAFEIAIIINHKHNSIITNPFMLTVAIVIISLVVLDISHAEYMQSAKYISFFSTPATIALALPLYNRVQEIRQNVVAILGSIVCGVLANIITILLMCKAFGFTHIEYVSILPKSITTPIALGICEEYGGISAITVLGVLISGTLGNVIGARLIALYRIKNPLSRGLALGTSAHALGTVAATQIGELEGAGGGLAIAITGVLTVFIAPFFANLI